MNIYWTLILACAGSWMMFELIWSNLKYIMSHAMDIHTQGQAQISLVSKVVYSNTMPQKQMH